VLTISEEQWTPVARYASPKAVPIEAGTTTVEARVTVTFELE
jgi:uncharacterized protein YggE